MGFFDDIGSAVSSVGNTIASGASAVGDFAKKHADLYVGGNTIMGLGHVFGDIAHGNINGALGDLQQGIMKDVGAIGKLSGTASAFAHGDYGAALQGAGANIGGDVGKALTGAGGMVKQADAVAGAFQRGDYGSALQLGGSAVGGGVGKALTGAGGLVKQADKLAAQGMALYGQGAAALDAIKSGNPFAGSPLDIGKHLAVDNAQKFLGAATGIKTPQQQRQWSVYASHPGTLGGLF